MEWRDLLPAKINENLEIKLAASDLELVRDFVSGNQRTFDAIYERYASYVYNTCVGMIGNPEDARDATQDAFVSIYKSLHRFRADSKFSTWVYRITINKCLDILRTRKKHRNTESLSWIEDLKMPEKDLVTELNIRELILKLKPEYRAVLVLFYFQELSYVEIAQSLGCSVNDVRIRIYRARKAFKVLYEEMDGKK